MLFRSREAGAGRRQGGRSRDLDPRTIGGRLSRVDADTRADALARLERAVARLDPEDLVFEGEVLCAIASK